jgi:hypothetical protein
MACLTRRSSCSLRAPELAANSKGTAMNNEPTQLEAELVYSEQQAARKLVDQVEKLAPTRLLTWVETLARESASVRVSQEE